MPNNLKKRESIFFIWIGFIIACLLILKPLFIGIIESAFNQESLGYLNNLIEKHRLKDPENRTIEFYLLESSRYLNRLAAIGAYFGLMIYLLSKNNFSLVTSFFALRSHPINLSVLRIAVYFILVSGSFYSLAITTHALGAESLIPPFGWGFLESIPYPNQTFVYLITGIFFVSNVFSLLGIYTRISIQISTITGFIVLGIPQMFGKINHYHILWHIMLMMCFAKNSNYLSIDRLLFKKDFGESDYKEAGIIVNSALIFIGIAYFFPGLWKFVFSGLEWALSDNLKYKLHAKWIELDGWKPFLRIDRYPLIYQSSALITLIFELSFLFAIFSKRLIYIYGIIGLSFHLMVALTMKIFFGPVIILYVLFIDWSFLAKKKINISFNTIKSIFGSRIGRVFSLIVTINLFAGLLLIDSWPFAVYPTFASMENESITTLTAEIETTEGSESIVPLVSFSIFANDFPTVPRFRGFLDGTLVRNDSSNFQKLSSILEKNFSGVNSIDFYQSIVSTNPDEDYQIIDKGSLIYSHQAE